MSWSIYCVGTPQAVAAEVNRSPSVPDSIKQCVTDSMAIFPEGEIAIVETHGHFNPTDQSHSTNGLATLQIRVQPAAKE